MLQLFWNPDSYCSHALVKEVKCHVSGVVDLGHFGQDVELSGQLPDGLRLGFDEGFLQVVFHTGIVAITETINVNRKGFISLRYLSVTFFKH